MQIDINYRMALPLILSHLRQYNTRSIQINERSRSPNDTAEVRCISDAKTVNTGISKLTYQVFIGNAVSSSNAK